MDSHNSQVQLLRKKFVADFGGLGGWY